MLQIKPCFQIGHRKSTHLLQWVCNSQISDGDVRMVLIHIRAPLTHVQTCAYFHTCSTCLHTRLHTFSDCPIHRCSQAFMLNTFTHIQTCSHTCTQHSDKLKQCLSTKVCAHPCAHTPTQYTRKDTPTCTGTGKHICGMAQSSTEDIGSTVLCWLL